MLMGLHVRVGGVSIETVLRAGNVVKSNAPVQSAAEPFHRNGLANW